jgi:DNA-binding PadR family transcriptional regulator
MSAAGEFARSAKQREIMGVVLAAMDAGEELTGKVLISRLSYKATHQAIYCSLDFLENHGLIHREYRGCRGVKITPTPKAYVLFRGSGQEASGATF